MSQNACDDRLLLLLGQIPHDPASGAARSMHTIARMLSASGFAVRVVATTASEQGLGWDAMAFLRQMVADVQVTNDGVLRFEQQGITYELLDVGRHTPDGWEDEFGEAFDRLLERTLEAFSPRLVFTYGGSAGDLRRRRAARRAGAQVVFGLRNLGYLMPGAFVDVDAILTGSRFVSERYREVLGIASTPLPLPIDLEEVVAPEREPIFITVVNPSIEKGVMFTARLAEELGRRRSDVPLLVVESRGTAGTLVAAGLAGGFDLRRHANLMVMPAAPRPRDLFAAARVLVAPSVWEEPAGRVVAEALVNGVPPVVSDRGGLAEMCCGGGIVLPMPAAMTLETRRPPDARMVEPWLEAILRLADDEAHYAAASAAARRAGEAYEPGRLREQYAAFFRGVRGTRTR